VNFLFLRNPHAAPRELFRYELEPGPVDEIRRATNGNYALGNAAFAAQVSTALGRRAVPGKTGGERTGSRRLNQKCCLVTEMNRGPLLLHQPRHGL